MRRAKHATFLLQIPLKPSSGSRFMERWASYHALSGFPPASPIVTPAPDCGPFGNGVPTFKAVRLTSQLSFLMLSTSCKTVIPKRVLQATSTSVLNFKKGGWETAIGVT